MRIATWNVNSVRARLPTVLAVLESLACDVVCLQEIKCVADAFPYEPIADLGYNCAVYGQKSYNGVAILSKYPMEDVIKGLPGMDDDQARYIEAMIMADSPVRIGGLYAPNGNPAPGVKYTYKRAWMESLITHAATCLENEEALVLCGDYNIIPRSVDCWDPLVWADDALALPEARAVFRRLIYLGLTDAFEMCDNRAHQYTFWDYQRGAFAKDHGIRIDHHLLGPQAADRLENVTIFREARAMDKPSDHVPVIVTLRDSDARQLQF